MSNGGSWFARRRWQVSVGTLLLLCCAMLLPMPQVSPPKPGKDLSSPFPCMDRPCGCASAEQCWKDCCCFNNQQKIAWAEQHDVAVPDFVIVAAQQEVSNPAVRAAHSKTPCPHCSTQASEESDNRSDLPLPTSRTIAEICGASWNSFPERQVVPENHKPAPSATRDSSFPQSPSWWDSAQQLVSSIIASWTTSTLDCDTCEHADGCAGAASDCRCGNDPQGASDGLCCEKEGQCCENDEPRGAEADSRRSARFQGPRFVLGFSALECHGLTSLWQILSVTMLPSVARIHVTGPALETTLLPVSDRLPCLEVMPPEPPPRIGVAGFCAVSA